MAKVPSVTLPQILVNTLAPPVNTVSSGTIPPDLTLEQWTAMGQNAAAQLPKCTIPITCGTPGVNDARAYTRHAPVNCPTCFWWLPVGTIVTSIRTFKAYWHVSQLGDLTSPVTQVINERIIPLGARTHLVEAWQRVSKENFDKRATTISADAPFGKSGTGLPISPGQVSVNRFLEVMRDFSLTYLDQRTPVMPTEAELTESGGVGRWRSRGGFALYKPALEGRTPLTRVSLWACADWCAGCVNPELYPGGTPTCATSIRVETENFDWGMFVKREPGSYVVSISRLPKSTWDKVEDGIRNVTDQLDSFIGFVCKTYNSPAGQAASSAGQSSTDPQTQIAARGYDTLLRNGCAPKESTGTSTTYNPSAPPTTGGRPPSASSAGNVLIPSAGQLAPPASSRVDMKMVFGLAALGLAAAGGAAIIRKRKRKS
jgi:hypothetical protein